MLLCVKVSFDVAFRRLLKLILPYFYGGDVCIVRKHGIDLALVGAEMFIERFACQSVVLQCRVADIYKSHQFLASLHHH